MEIISVFSKEGLIKHSEFIKSLDLKPGEDEYLKLFRMVDNPKQQKFKER